MKVSIGGVLKDVTAIKVCIGGSWKSATNTRLAVGGAWKEGETFTGGGSGGFLLGISPDSVSGFGGGTVTTSATTATPVGGVAPFTYSWSRLSGSGSANSPTSATTTFTDTGIPSFTTTNGVFRCTATDAIGSSATADVSAEFYNNTFS